jgi:hypothetical protein
VHARVSEWSLSTFPSPIPELQHAPLPLKCCELGSMPRLLLLPLLLGPTFGSFEELGVRHCKDGKVCCTRNVMASQPDFKAQHCLLEELLVERGHLSIFYPKFHCKLNYIENFWAVVKRRTRDNYNYILPELCNAVPRALTDVLVVEICRYTRCAFRYMDAY